MWGPLFCAELAGCDWLRMRLEWTEAYVVHVKRNIKFFNWLLMVGSMRRDRMLLLLLYNSFFLTKKKKKYHC